MIGSGELYSRYTPFSTEGAPHPTGLVESTSLASVSIPASAKAFKLSFDAGNSGLSNEQIDALKAIGARTERFLPAGSGSTRTRAGLLLGDGTGVGKGRIAAGFIKDLWMRGIRRFLWITIIKALVDDVERDLKDVGVTDLHGFALLELDELKPKDIVGPRTEDGALFSTYALLVRDDRFKQVKRYLTTGPNGKGAIIFDESHRAKNAEKTATGRAVMRLQEELPDVYVLYMSATAATTFQQLDYMPRLGLWGPGTPFSTFKDLSDTLKKSSGRAALESVAVDCKAMGSYLARSLNQEGNTFEIRPVELQDTFVQTYDRVIELVVALFGITRRWASISEFLDDPLKKRAVGMQFFAFALRLCRSVVVSAKIPELVKIVEQSVQNDKSVIIYLASTGEAQTDRKLLHGDPDGFVENADDEEELDDGVSGLASAPLGMLKDTLSWLMCRILKAPEGDPPEGKLWPKWVKPSRLPNVEDLDVDDGEKMRVGFELDRIMAMARTSGIDAIANPLDKIIEALGGTSKVAELTARKHRLVPDGRGRYIAEPKPSSDKEFRAFRNERKLVVIVSDAFSSGVSLHASPKFRNKRKRGSCSFCSRLCYITLHSERSFGAALLGGSVLPSPWSRKPRRSGPSGGERVAFDGSCGREPVLQRSRIQSHFDGCSNQRRSAGLRPDRYCSNGIRPGISRWPASALPHARRCDGEPAERRRFRVRADAYVSPRHMETGGAGAGRRPRAIVLRRCSPVPHGSICWPGRERLHPRSPEKDTGVFRLRGTFGRYAPNWEAQPHVLQGLEAAESHSASACQTSIALL
ncbi:P-loop containing NTP hydrolase pore-1-domain-containing protein [Hyaloraphidium curvatum]|nr:P-loop containing NTP hydrolase pore-1-domain-containing protein [Hyaloraphidium curvatum]